MTRAATALLMFTLGCASKASQPSGSYVFVWAGADSTSSDFLGVIDADSASPRYGTIVASVPTGMKSTHPHHTEQQMAPNGHLLANGFHAGRTWLFNLSDPLHPAIETSFGDVGGYSYPHTYVRLANGNVLATFQRSGEPSAMDGMSHDMTRMPGVHESGGLVEMDERGTLIRATSARDTTISDRRLYPYSVLPIPALDVAVSYWTPAEIQRAIGSMSSISIRPQECSSSTSDFATPAPPARGSRWTERRGRTATTGVPIHTERCSLDNHVDFRGFSCSDVISSRRLSLAPPVCWQAGFRLQHRSMPPRRAPRVARS